MYIFFEERFTQRDQKNLFDLMPFEGFVMPGIGEIDRSGFGGKDFVIGRVFPGSVFNKDKGIKVGPVYRGFIGHDVVNVSQIVDGELGLCVDSVDGQSEIDVLLVQGVECQYLFFGRHERVMIGCQR